MFIVYDYECPICGRREEDYLSEKCGSDMPLCAECKTPMDRLFPCPRGGEERGNFKPFWSDTFEMRVNDREDLKKLKDLRRANNLECVGHRKMKEDRRAVRHNYETD